MQPLAKQVFSQSAVFNQATLNLSILGYLHLS